MDTEEDTKARVAAYGEAGIGVEIVLKEQSMNAVYITGDI